QTRTSMCIGTFWDSRASDTIDSVAVRQAFVRNCSNTATPAPPSIGSGASGAISENGLGLRPPEPPSGAVGTLFYVDAPDLGRRERVGFASLPDMDMTSG